MASDEGLQAMTNRKKPKAGGGLLSALAPARMFGGAPDKRRPVKLASDLELFCVDRGRGAPIVFMPGFTFSGEVFEHQIEPFSKDRRVVVIDPRSHGRSSKTADGNNYPQHGHDLNNLFEKLGLEDITLVAWSFGALSAWSYAEQYGLDRLKRFVCVDMPPVPMSANENDWVEASVADLAGGYHVLLTPEGQRGFMGHYAREVMVQRDLTDQEFDWLMDISLQTPTAAVKDLYASGLFSNYLETAKRIAARVPTMFFLAEHWAETALAYVQRETPEASHKVLGGHMMFWEHPMEFNAALSAFLNET
ncbi:MAG: alpha/beta hydrolase [Pseudomonadota bacterium]